MQDYEMFFDTHKINQNKECRLRRSQREVRVEAGNYLVSSINSVVA